MADGDATYDASYAAQMVIRLFEERLDMVVPRQPTAILATGLVLLSALSFIAGMILDTVTRGRLAMRRLAYLAVPPPDPQAA
jgi:hypothetical protein